MISAVLDPGVLLQGLGWRDAPASRVVSAALAGRFVPVTSPALLAELEALLGRHELGRAFGPPARLVELVERMSLVVRTPGRDHPLLEAAHVGGAPYAVTGDFPLLDLGTWRGVRIVRPL